VVIAGSDKTTRRRGGRRASAPVDVGQVLRDAREGLGLTVPEIHDRTGVPGRYLEALDTSDLTVFPDERTALVSLRRYADVLQLDGAKLTQAVHERWNATTPAAAPATGAAATSAGPTAIGWTESSNATGHLRRYPADDEHLRAFSRTAQVPQVRRPGASGVGLLSTVASGASVTPTPMGPSHSGYLRRPRAPRLLKVALWVTAVALLAAGAGLVVHHYKPQWLRDIHLMHGTPAPVAGPPATVAPPSGPVVATTTSDGTTTSVVVRAAVYLVEVVPRAPCWIQVFHPGDPQAVFSGVLEPGETQSFAPKAGLLSVQFGASAVSVQVVTNGSAAPAWSYRPTVAPFQLNFSSTI
jgi:hypothetical protein